MKRLLYPILVAFFATVSFSSFSQITVGPKLGVNFNSFRNSKAFRDHFDVIPGFNVGGFAKYPVLPYLTARAELLYMQQGANTYDYRVINDLYHKNSKIRFHNIEIPVLAELGLPSLEEDALRPKLLIGGFYSYTLAARETYTNIITVSGRPKLETDGYINMLKHINRSQYGFILALAAEMKAFNLPVSVEFRYQYNANKINQASSLYNLAATHEKWGNKLYLHTLSINVGVSLYNF
jgi:hypothetical protein